MRVKAGLDPDNRTARVVRAEPFGNAGLSVAAASLGRRGDPMTAEQILDRVAGVYAGCRSYRDSGCARSRFLGLPGLPEFETDKPFRTAFVRPDRFRFEFSDPGGTEPYRYIVHAAGDVFQTWWDVRPGVERKSSLGLAVAGAAGVSDGAAHTVPALLMPEPVGGLRLTGLLELARLDDGDLTGAECYRLRGRPPGPAGAQAAASQQLFREMTGIDPPAEFEPMVLWIDQRTLLLRRVEGRHRLPFGESVQVTTYEPEVDVRISDEELSFDPPGP
jgi:hypothetical protein